MNDPPSSTTVLVVRHAHVHNPGNILYGRLPRFRLSEEGRRQAHATGRFLSARKLAAVYSSPLLRARQTAEIISSYHPHMRVRFSRLLLESRSAYEGKPNSILKPGFSFYEPRLDPCDESMQDIWDRMSRMLRRVTARHTGETVVLVSHADPITILRLGLEGREMTVRELHATTYAGRSSVTEIVYSPAGPLSLTYFNVGESRDRPPQDVVSRSVSA